MPNGDSAGLFQLSEQAPLANDFGITWHFRDFCAQSIVSVTKGYVQRVTYPVTPSA